MTVRLQKLSIFLRNYRDCKAVAFRKVLIFLRIDSDCKDVDLYNSRKRYAVIESSDLMRNTFWLASCFSKIKKPIKDCSGNQSVIAGVCIFDMISYIYP